MLGCNSSVYVVGHWWQPPVETLTSEAASERVFSAAKRLITPLRNRLTPERVDQILSAHFTLRFHKIKTVAGLRELLS